MGLRSKGVTFAGALTGLVVFSQAPEFSQQYRQRLGGALEELQQVVKDFDADAAASGLDRSGALQQMKSSDDRLVMDRGQSMHKVISRHEALSAQKYNMDNAHPMTRPLFILRYPDTKVLNGAWEDYEPAVPVTQAGIVFGGTGALLMLFLSRLGIGSWRRQRQARRDRKLQDAVVRSSHPDQIA